MLLLGVILSRPEFDTCASFYVPRESVVRARARDGLPVASSHVLLDMDPQLGMEAQLRRKVLYFSQLAKNSEIRLIVPISMELLNLDFYLLSTNVFLVMLVPVVNSIHHWNKLRRFGKKHHLILDLNQILPHDLLQRYKCLSYEAVVATHETIEQAGLLMTKRRPVHLLVHQEEFKTILASALTSAVNPQLEPCSDELIDPLQPLTRDLALEVYQEFEKDKAKYSQYEAAIEMAIGDLRRSKPCIKILVVGPGRGPLLRMVMRFTTDADSIVAIEKNEKCIEILRSQVKRHQLITVLLGDVRNLAEMNHDLIVSEMLGSFGCNEASPEILQNCTAPESIVIPQLYTSFLQSAYCDVFDEFHLRRPYVARLNSYFPLDAPVPVLNFLHPGVNILNQEATVKVTLSPQNPCNVLIGTFEAHLYGPYHIGITPQTHDHERCSSWYPMLFPVGDLDTPTTINFLRKSTHAVMWYEWEVGSAWFNKEAADYAVDL